MGMHSGFRNRRKPLPSQPEGIRRGTDGVGVSSDSSPVGSIVLRHKDRKGAGEEKRQPIFP